jgi:hypothetical protein
MTTATSIANAAFAAVPAGLKGTVVFTRTVLGTFNPATGTRTGDATETATGVAVMGAARRSFGDTFDENQTIMQRYRTLTVRASGLAFAPAVGQLAVMGGRTWTVRAVAPVMPDGNAAGLYECSVEAT